MDRALQEQEKEKELKATINDGEEPTSSSSGNKVIGVSKSNYYTEMIIPHVVQDAVRKRFFSLKGSISYCFGVHVDFKHSDSMIKSPTLILSAKKKEEMGGAMVYLNQEVEKECTAIGARKHYMGCVIDNLGFLGGVLSSEDYNLLFFRTDTGYAFKTSFEKENQCAIWVKAVDDGRHERDAPRKIYFGAPPHKISVLWGHIQTCLANCKREGKVDGHQDACIQTCEENDDGIADVDGTTSVKNAPDIIASPEGKERSNGNNDMMNRTDQSSQTNCMHGFKECYPVCSDFIVALQTSFSKAIGGVDTKNTPIVDLKDYLEVAHAATMDKFAEVWDDSAMMQMAISFSLYVGTDAVLDGHYNGSKVIACFVRYLEEHIAVEIKQTRALCNWPKIYEVATADMHTLVKFFSKRTPCSCLDEKYREVKNIPKMSLCYNPQCTIPNGMVNRTKIMCCGRCQSATYCSRQCQKSHWRAHKPSCNSYAEVKAEFEANQQNM